MSHFVAAKPTALKVIITFLSTNEQIYLKTRIDLGDQESNDNLIILLLMLVFKKLPPFGCTSTLRLKGPCQAEKRWQSAQKCWDEALLCHDKKHCMCVFSMTKIS